MNQETENGVGKKTTLTPEEKSARRKASQKRRDARRPEAIAAVAVGLSVSTCRKASAVCEAAKADKERFGDLPALMDRTNNVSLAYRELQKRLGKSTGEKTPLDWLRFWWNKATVTERAKFYFEAITDDEDRDQGEQRLRAWAASNPALAVEVGAIGVLKLLDGLRADLRRAAERIAAQSELLAKKAEKAP